MPRKFFGSPNISPNWRDEEFRSTLNYPCERLGCLVSLYYWALEWSIHAESEWQLGEDAQPFLLIEKDLWVLGLRTIDELWRLERRDAIRSVSAQASEPPCRKHSFGLAEVKEGADEILTVELPFEGNSEQDRPMLTGSALVKRVQFHDGIDAIPWTAINGALYRAYTNAERHLKDAGVHWNGPPLFWGCRHGRQLVIKAALRKMEPAVVLDKLDQRNERLIEEIETVFRVDVQREQARDKAGARRSPYALAAAHRELMSELEKGIQQWRQSGRFSNPQYIHRRIERFIDALDQIAGGKDELRRRATLLDICCGPGTDYDSTRKKALASYKGQPRKLSGSKQAIDRLRKSTARSPPLANVNQTRQDIKRVLSEGILNLSAATREAFENWCNACRQVEREAGHLEVDGCWYLFNVHEAGGGRPSEQAKSAITILESNLGGGNLETIKAAAASLMDSVPSVEVIRQDGKTDNGTPKDSGSAASAVSSVPDHADGMSGGESRLHSLYHFQWKGANFMVLFDGEEGSIPISLNGGWFIFWLLQSPNAPMSSTSLRQLLAVRNGADSSAVSPDADAQDQQDGPVIEDTSDDIEFFKRLAVKLADSAAAARVRKDLPAQEEALGELADVTDALQKLRGKGGKPRTMRSDEADRVAVKRAIQKVITKCKTKWAMPRLSKHLTDTIDTGQHVCYLAGENPPSWIFF